MAVSYKPRSGSPGVLQGCLSRVSWGYTRASDWFCMAISGKKSLPKLHKTWTLDFSASLSITFSFQCALRCWLVAAARLPWTFAQPHVPCSGHWLLGLSQAPGRGEPHPLLSLSYDTSATAWNTAGKGWLVKGWTGCCKGPALQDLPMWGSPLWSSGCHQVWPWARCCVLPATGEVSCTLACLYCHGTQPQPSSGLSVRKMPMVKHASASCLVGMASWKMGCAPRQKWTIPGLNRDQVKITKPQLSWGKEGHYCKVRTVKCCKS